jgi:hypothetical protein
MSDKKTITINPLLFQLNKKNRTQKKEKKEKPIPLISPNILKKNLLQKIKDHQNEQKNVSNTTLDNNAKDTLNNNAFSDEFKNSINYLSNLINKTKMKNRTLKKQNNEFNNNNNTYSPAILENSFEENLISTTPMINSNINTRPINTPRINTPSLNTPSLNTQPINTQPINTQPINTQPINTQPINTQPINNVIPDSFLDNSSVSQQSSSNKTTGINQIDPPYGCLKNANKPTYRNWLRHTQKNRDNHDNINSLESKMNNSNNIENNVSNNINNTREDKLSQIKNKFNQSSIIENEAKSTNCIIKKTIKKKYKLGKSKKKSIISVLIKGSTFRQKIANEKHNLSKKNINHVKIYLKKHGLLKSGSSCPNDILRKMYEDSILTGYITNKNKDTLIHNFLNL